MATNSDVTSRVNLVILQRIHFYIICFGFGFCLHFLSTSRYLDSTYYYRPFESHGNTSKYDVEKILQKTRLNIKTALLQYNFNYSGVRELKDLVIETGGKPIRSIILSTWRSGTTFLGEILNTTPGNFYHYEPLLSYDIVRIRGPPLAVKAIDTIKNMLNCNFKNTDQYFEYGKNHTEQFVHNSRLWDYCEVNKELCFDVEFTTKFCKLFPFQSMKVLRIRLGLVEELLQDKELNVKVILLIRDPRGVMQSRKHREFCHLSPDCWQEELVCADMISDYTAASRLLKIYPDRLIVLRYEELALNPKLTTKKLLKFLRLHETPHFEEFLDQHTNADSGGVSSTYRLSKNVPFRWKNDLSFEFVDKIQTACKDAMQLWGYRIAQNATHMISDGFYPLGEYSIKL